MLLLLLLFGFSHTRTRTSGSNCDCSKYVALGVRRLGRKPNTNPHVIQGVIVGDNMSVYKFRSSSSAVFVCGVGCHVVHVCSSKEMVARGAPLTAS